MSKQRMINTKFWSDPFVVDDLNPLDRYIFLYLLTNEKANIIGAYEISLKTISNETGIEKDEVFRMISRLESKVTYISGWVVFRKSIKHQNYNSPKIAAAIARELKELPKEVISYIEVPESLQRLLLDTYGIHTVSIPYIYPTAPNLTKPNLTKPKLGVIEKTNNPKIDDEVSKLYYEVIKKFGLPTKNHNNVRTSIKKLVNEAGQGNAIKYLEFLLKDYQNIEIDFKPELNESLDIQAKRLQIINAVRRVQKNQAKNEIDEIS